MTHLSLTPRCETRRACILSPSARAPRQRHARKEGQTMTQQKQQSKRIRNRKRVLSVTVRQMLDDSPDSSYIGEYGNSPKSDYAIDRAHSEDCQSINLKAKQAIERLERIISHVEVERQAAGNDSENTEWESLDESINALVSVQDHLAECDCGFSSRWNN